ncbi:MAG: hypothetical protein J0I32_24225 [Sphingobacteriales bacterium]|nr:hypothetical protein [Sphingobacteriales bacterium]
MEPHSIQLEAFVDVIREVAGGNKPGGVGNTVLQEKRAGQMGIWQQPARYIVRDQQEQQDDIQESSCIIRPGNPV